MAGPRLPGSPIRRPAGRRVCAPNRGLSQLAASFIGFLCQGIRRAPYISSAPRLARGTSAMKSMMLMSNVRMSQLGIHNGTVWLYSRSHAPHSLGVGSSCSDRMNACYHFFKSQIENRVESEYLASAPRYAALKVRGGDPGDRALRGSRDGMRRTGVLPRAVEFKCFFQVSEFSLERR